MSSKSIEHAASPESSLCNSSDLDLSEEAKNLERFMTSKTEARQMECKHNEFNIIIIFLGIILDERLNFNKHIESLNFRAAKRLNIMKIFSHSKWRMNHHTLKSIYKSLVDSLFGYSSFIIANISESSLSSLQRLQNSAIRCIYKLPFNSLNHLLYPISNILPIKERFKQLGCRHLTKAMNRNNFIIQLVREYPGSISAISAKYKESTPLCILLPIVALAFACKIFIFLMITWIGGQEL